jgi:hypothetical protein
MKNIKIGITILLEDATQSQWSNGLRQNVMFFADMLKLSKENYLVYILNVKKIEGRPNWIPEGIEFEFFDENYLDMDLLIVMGSQIYNSQIDKFKSDKNKRFIAYKCGNNYMGGVQNILFKNKGKEDKSTYQWETQYDEIWYVPQQHSTNSGYFRTLYRTNAIPVPFIWSEKMMKESLIDVEKSHLEGRFKRSRKYRVGEKKKTIGVLEPNIDIVKFCMIPAMIAEESYRTDIGKEHIESLMITNAYHLKSDREFTSIMNTFDLQKDGKLSVESRYRTGFMVSQYLDIVISHQVLNPLNYLYLDIAYMGGFPLLHNAPLVKDLGYYYDESDTYYASKILNDILINHDSRVDEYNERNDLVLQRYHLSNPDIIETYDRLIDGLWRGGNKDLLYNWKTNLFDNMA